jgi:hypothetical protein
MDGCKVAENHTGGKDEKIFGRGLGGDAVASGLLAAHRWGLVDAKLFAAHAGVTYEHAVKNLLPGLRGNHPLLKKLTPSNRTFGGGRPPYFYALTRRGYDELSDAVSDCWAADPAVALGEFVTPPTSVRWSPTTPHKMMTKAALLAAERGAISYPSITVVDQIAEFRAWNKKRHPTAATTPDGVRFKVDAVNIVEMTGMRWADQIEIDMGSESLISSNPDRMAATVEGKIRTLWKYLASGDVKTKYSVNSLMFRVLFVTTSHERARNIASLAGDCGLMPIKSDEGEIDPEIVFRATTSDRAANDFYGKHWLRCDGEEVGLA